MEHTRDERKLDVHWLLNTRKISKGEPEEYLEV